jgi:hypothetical protein
MKTEIALSNRHWVGPYSKWLTVLGTIVLVGGVASLFAVVIRYLPNVDRWQGVLILHGVLSTCLRGFIAVGLAKFLVYALGTSQQPGWIISWTEKALYILGALTVSFWLVQTVQQCLFGAYQRFPGEGVLSAAVLALSIGRGALESISMALVWVALGLVLRRVMPIIEESKTLV